MPTLHVLRVFLGPGDSGGNPLGVFLEGSDVPEARRQAVAADLGFSETVFVEAVEDDAARIRIFTPARELRFAGHPSVGTSWLLAQLGRTVRVLHVRAGDVATWHADALTWIRARPEWAPEMVLAQLDAPAKVDALTGPPPGEDSWYAWAWISEPAGEVRSRYFGEEFGITEDEATGAAAVRIGGILRRPLTIRQGVGSQLHVRPARDGWVEVGGRSTLEDVREY